MLPQENLDAPGDQFSGHSWAKFDGFSAVVVHPLSTCRLHVPLAHAGFRFTWNPLATTMLYKKFCCTVMPFTYFTIRRLCFHHLKVMINCAEGCWHSEFNTSKNVIDTYLKQVAVQQHMNEIYYSERD